MWNNNIVRMVYKLTDLTQYDQNSECSFRTGKKGEVASKIGRYDEVFELIRSTINTRALVNRLLHFAYLYFS